MNQLPVETLENIVKLAKTNNLFHDLVVKDQYYQLYQICFEYNNMNTVIYDCENVIHRDIIGEGIISRSFWNVVND